MKVCVVELIGVQYKKEITDKYDDEQNLDDTVRQHISDIRVFDDIFKAVDIIRQEEESNGLIECWIDEEHNEKTDEVDYIYLNFKDGYSKYKFDKSYYLHLIDVE